MSSVSVKAVIFLTVVSCMGMVDCIKANAPSKAVEGPDRVVREVWVVTERGNSVHTDKF